MTDSDVERIVAKAISKERRLWYTVMAVILCLQLFQGQFFTSGTVSDVSKVTGIQEKTQSLRRRLMSVEEEIGAPPAPEAEAVGPSPAPEVESYVPDDPTMCNCPAGPRGPPGEPAPSFLSEVFEWDEDRRALVIKASTMDLGGHLIVNGFTGIRQSLFIGGDPNSGESATEISPGSILLYKRGGDPSMAGFTTSDDGYELSNIEVMGGLLQMDPNTAESKPVGK